MGRRTDSGIGVEPDSESASEYQVDGDGDGERLTNSTSSKVGGEKEHPKPELSKRYTSISMTSRKRSLSSTHRKSSSRSSSIQSRRNRRDGIRPRVGRFNTSPINSATRSNREDALALHERSCRLMETLSLASNSVAPAQAPLHRVVTPPYYTTGALPTEEPAPTDYSLNDNPSFPVTHWTSIATRRQQYAEIDKRNSGFRKFIRKVLPGCFSKQTSLDFFDEKDDSDVASVRRYRLELPDEETH